MQDKTIVCKDCGKEFVFTVGEQQFYAERVLKMNLSVVRNVVRQERTVCVKTRRCMR